MTDPIVLVGGFAAAHAATELRSAGYAGPLVLITEEAHVPYERPPLSKGYLLGNDELTTAHVHPAEWYADNDVDLRLSCRVTSIDPARHVVTTDAGEQPYSQLVLATGARANRLTMADESGAEVAYLRTIGDSERIKAALGEGRRVVVIGGGWIGLEVASAAVAAGAGVVVLEALEKPLVRVLGPEVAERLTQIHRDHGVDVRTGVTVSAISPDGVTLADGSTLPADLVVVGVGVTPNSELAATAGLATDNGVLVDAALRTSDPDVFAIGDVANQDHPTLGRRLRVEHWDTALQQAKAVAHSLLGEDVSYAELPYFFSDQYDVGLEYVGNPGPAGYDDVVIRDGEGSSFVAWWLRDGVVVAGMHLDDWDAIDEIRSTVGTRAAQVGMLQALHR